LLISGGGFRSWLAGGRRRSTRDHRERIHRRELLLHQHRLALIPRTVGLEHVDDDHVAAPLERHAGEPREDLLIVELLEALLECHQLGLELLLRERRLTALAVDVDLRVERVRQQANPAQVAHRARDDHRIAPAAEREDAAEPHRELLARRDQRLLERAQVDFDHRIVLRLGARRRRLIVDDHQAALAAAAERHRWRQLHLGARIEAIDVEQLLRLQDSLAPEAIDQRLLIDRRRGLEHQVRDDAVELEHCEASIYR
jgi:hypothetical protein